MRKFLLASIAFFGLAGNAFAQNGPGCTTLSLTVGCYIYPQAVLQIPQILPNGTVTAPALAWQNFPSTGLYINPTTGAIDTTIAGVFRGELSTNGWNSVGVGQTTPALGSFTILTATQRFRNATWATSGRPSNPVVGEQGWNTTINATETWNGSAWVVPGGGPTQIHASALLAWSNNVTVAAGTYNVMLSWPWATGVIQSVTYNTNGSSSPSFTVALSINGTAITGCSAVVVNSATVATTTCSAANNVTTGGKVQAVISSIVGTPNLAGFQINYFHSEP